VIAVVFHGCRAARLFFAAIRDSYPETAAGGKRPYKSRLASAGTAFPGEARFFKEQYGA
jgi:hypothetical protein